MSKSYDEMSIEELLREEKRQYAKYDGEASLHITFVVSDRRAARDTILDLAESLESEGLVVVPIKPTKEMLWAPWWGDEGMKEICEIVWEDMIAASPLPSPCESKGG